jgi:hypothetical protein
MKTFLPIIICFLSSIIIIFIVIIIFLKTYITLYPSNIINIDSNNSLKSNVIYIGNIKGIEYEGIIEFNLYELPKDINIIKAELNLQYEDVEDDTFINIYSFYNCYINYDYNWDDLSYFYDNFNSYIIPFKVNRVKFDIKSQINELIKCNSGALLIKVDDKNKNYYINIYSISLQIEYD